MDRVTELVDAMIGDLESQVAEQNEGDAQALTDILLAGLENVAMALEMACLPEMASRCQRLQAQVAGTQTQGGDDRSQVQRQSRSVLAWLKRLATLVAEEPVPDDAGFAPLDMPVASPSSSPSPSPVQAGLSPSQAQMLEQFWAEVAELLPDLEAMRAELDAPMGTEAYLALLDNLAQAAACLELKGLAGFIHQLQQRVAHYPQRPAPAEAAALQALLAVWPGLLQAYLCRGATESSVLALLDFLDDSRWGGEKVAPDAVQPLLTDLLTLPGMAEAEADETLWTAEDVALPPQATVDPHDPVWQAFIQDAPVQVAALTRALQQLARARADALASDELQQWLHQAQRASHTLKGAANLLGIRGVATLSHQLEAAFEGLVDEPQCLTSSLSALLNEAADSLGMMVDALLGLDKAPDNALALVQKLAYWRDLAATDAAAMALSVPAPVVDGPADIPVESAPPVPPATQAAETSAVAEAAGGVNGADRAEGGQEIEEAPVDELLVLAEEMSVNYVQTRELYRHIRAVGTDLKRQDNQLQARRLDLEALVDGRSMARNPARVAEVAPEFDPLELDRYDDLHRSTHQYFESVADLRALNDQLQDKLALMDRLMGQQHRFIDQLAHQLLLRQRVSAQTLAPRLQRCVRQAARHCDKEVILELMGGELGIDRDLLEKLAPPLMHLLRNAVDHGIESAPRRMAQGKPVEGKVVLSFCQTGRFLQLRVSDDGQGLDYDAIYQRALRRQLLKAQEGRPGDAELAAMIWLPGFSTRDSSTQLSGRGIGMDAVKAQVEALGGQVRYLPEAAGACFELRLPVKEITQYMLLVEAGGRRFALPTANLQQILPRDSYPCQRLGGRSYLMHQERLYRYEDLATCLHLTPADPDRRRAVILMQWEQQDIALAVEALHSGERLVQRGSGKLVAKLPALAGLSILGDGTLVPVLHLAELLAMNAPPRVAITGRADAVSAAGASRERRVLVVDDSLSVRSTLKRLLQDEGYQVITAVDGVEALDKLAATPVDALLVDMEMPRMDGLELTRHVRQRPQWHALPVLMLTSRSHEKHRALAHKAGVSAFKTKPYQEGELLDTLAQLLVLAETAQTPGPEARHPEGVTAGLSESYPQE